MRKIFIIAVFFLISSYGVEIEIKPDKNIEVSSSDIAAMKQYLKRKYRFVTTNEGAEKLVKENRLLANAFLKSKFWKNYNKHLLKIELETKLADEFVKRMQKEVKIPQKALKAYYYDHLKDFKQSPLVHLERYSFDSYDKALRFYEARKKDASVAPKDFDATYIKDNGEIELDRIKDPLQSLIKEHGKGYISPPFIWSKDRYDVYYVKDYKKGDGYKPFEKVKKEIENILYKKTFVKKRDEILASKEFQK